jgi:hypothetical protein
MFMSRYQATGQVHIEVALKMWHSSNVGGKCVSSAFGVEPRRMLRISQRFGKHCSCYLQDEYIVVGRYFGRQKMVSLIWWCWLVERAAMFAETSDNSQHSTWLNTESRSYTLNSSRGNFDKSWGTMLTDQNCIYEEIKSRLNSVNACYHAVQNLLSSHLLSKNVKIKVNKTIILPVILYGLSLLNFGLSDFWDTPYYIIGLYYNFMVLFYF